MRILMTIIVFSSFLCGQESITRCYDISQLLRSSQQQNYEQVGFVSQSWKVPARTKLAGHSRQNLQIANSLIKIIKEQVIQGWSKYHNIYIQKDLLYVTQTAIHQRRIADFLQTLETYFTSQITLSVKVYKVSKSMFAPSLGKEKLPLDQWQVIAAGRLSTLKNQRGQLPYIRKVLYLRDYDVEIAEQYSLYDPITDAVKEGVIFDFQAVPSYNGKKLYLRGGFGAATINRPISTYMNNLTKIQLPGTNLHGVWGIFSAPIGSTSVLGYYPYNNDIHIVTVLPVCSVLKNSGSMAFFHTKIFSWLEKSHLDYRLERKIAINDESFPKKTAFFSQPKQTFKIKGISRELLRLLKVELKREKLPDYFSFYDILGFRSHKQDYEDLEKAFGSIENKFVSTMKVNMSCLQIKESLHKEFLTKFAHKDKLSQQEIDWLRKSSQQVDHLSTRALVGQQALVYSLTTHPFVKDYDIEIAKAAGIMDPIIGYISEGVKLEVRPIAVRGSEVKLYLDGNSNNIIAMEKFVLADNKISIQHPQLERYTIKGEFKVTLGQEYMAQYCYDSGKLMVFTVKVE